MGFWKRTPEGTICWGAAGKLLKHQCRNVFNEKKVKEEVSIHEAADFVKGEVPEWKLRGEKEVVSGRSYSERRSQREASRILKGSQAVWCCGERKHNIWLTLQSWNPDFVPGHALNLWNGISHVAGTPFGLNFSSVKQFVHPKPEEAVFSPGSVPGCFSGSCNGHLEAAQIKSRVFRSRQQTRLHLVLAELVSEAGLRTPGGILKPWFSSRCGATGNCVQGWVVPCNGGGREEGWVAKVRT